MNDNYQYCSQALKVLRITCRVRFVLFGFMNNLASHLERFPSIHSFGCASAGDRPTCFASLPKKSKSFMQYAGK